MKVVQAAQMNADNILYETDYQYDGRGQLVRERIFRWYDSGTGIEQMKITQDVEYIYDLGRNVTQVKFTDDRSWVYTETRTHARGYQLTDFSEQHATGVTVITGGSYTYDANNNMTGTKKFSVYRQGLPLVQLAYRAGWTFTFDRKNRLKSHTHNETDDVTHLWWDGLGRVWQRWDYDSGGEMWSDYLTRFVYDGGVLAQEHLFDVFGESSWDYTYVRLTHDYLRQPAGTRDRKATNGGYVDYFLLSDMGTISGRFTRGSSLSLEKAQREIAGDRQARYSVAGGPPTTGDFTDVSNLGFASTYIESFGGTKSGDAQFFDALNQMGDRHYLPGLGRYIAPRGNNRYLDPSGGFPGAPYGGTGGGGALPTPPYDGGTALKYRRVAPSRLSTRRIGKGKQSSRGGSTGGQQRECKCEDCLDLLDPCIIINPDDHFLVSMYDFCCQGGIAACMLTAPDPCIPDPHVASCAELVCGSSDELGTECFCKRVDEYSLNLPDDITDDEYIDHVLSKAAYDCDVCLRGPRRGVCDDYSRDEVKPVNWICAACACVRNLRPISEFECCYYLAILGGGEAWDRFIKWKYEYCLKKCEGSAWGVIPCNACCKGVVDAQKAFCEALSLPQD